ncbi:hypothetical protein AAFL31_00185 [Klebsiella huaxiensis]|uniref:hypothetical protein n=1 Tax=Klebsiella huaxiensis TaxID=2153354 RepID=UPI0031616E4B
MKSNAMNKNRTGEHDASTQSASSQKTSCETDKQKRNKEFINAMNDFIAKNGTITEDEFFRVF